jgi:anaerobic selenocysteine-containing dehydrogenase
MTNHWNDIDNASCVFVFGANPAENHPACMAHVNAARFNNGKNAKLIVVDPRLTRTARQCDPARGDLFVRVRPGTNVAFANGLLNWIFNNIATYNSTLSTRMLAYHNGTNAGAHLSKARTFVDDAGTTLDANTSGATANGVITLNATNLATAKYDGVAAPQLYNGYPKYADTRFKVNTAGTDYQRAALTVGPNAGYLTDATYRFANFPVIAADVSDADSVYQKLILHVAPYDTATVAGICGCTEADIIAVAKALIDNSRFASADWDATQATPQALDYKATTILYAMGQTQHTNGSQNIKDLAIIQTLLGNMGRAGGGINALRGIHNVQGSTDMGLLYDSIPAYSANPAVDEHYSHYLNGLFGNRVENGTAPVTSGAKAYNTLSNLGLQQRGFANMTTEWFGTGASVGTDIEKLYELWPKGNGIQHITTFRKMLDSAVAAAYLKVNTTAANSDVTFTAVTAGDKGNGIGIEYFQNGLDTAISVTVVGKAITVILGTTGSTITSTANDVKAAVDGSAAAHALVTTAVEGDGTGVVNVMPKAYLAGGWDRIKATVCWGQNPAVTEPNQSAVRAGLRNLDLLVVVDMFETETAACDRKPGAPTYLIPACSHVEEAGSVTNSGRWLQWRERATTPKGNSKADMELLLRFAYALDQASAFSHIIGVWASLPTTPITPAVPGRVYTELYGSKYGYTPNGTPGSFEALSTSTEMWPARGLDGVPVTAPVPKTVYGSEVVTEAIYKEMCRPLNYLADGTFTLLTGGTMWIYSGAGTASPGPDTTGGSGYNFAYNYNLLPAVTSSGNTVNWQVKNRAKSRNNAVKGDDTNGANNFPRWGWAWLLNRRVFYNNGEVAGDQSDTFVSPGLVSCLFTMNVSGNALGDWSLAYRKYKTFADAPSVTTGPHYYATGKTYFGRFPGHTEPYESPREADLVPLWGHNQAGTSRLITSGDAVGTVATYPLVLTSIRCVEHFQGGPITRNNTWNVEAEPVPWIEINAADARTYGIADGDWVNVKTIRSNSGKDQEDETPANTVHWAKGFKARVGVGLESNQRVARGVVAIPWHWGDKGLSTGSRANDLCIDAWDANSQIPEYKACLCSIEKM